MEVNKENMRLFIEALRSGEYRQTTKNLAVKRGDSEWGYCCLGVACEVAIASGVELEVTESETRYTESTIYRRRYNGTAAVMPEPVVEWLGLPPLTADPDLIVGDGEIRCASYLNDDRKLTFAQIADAFERTFLKETNEDSSISA